MERDLPDISLYQIQIFLAVAEEKSFSRAAQRMYVSQPTASKAITRLEKELGMKLFERTTRKIELTEPGRRMYMFGRFIFTEFAEIAGNKK